jgi:hypothetical protein
LVGICGLISPSSLFWSENELQVGKGFFVCFFFFKKTWCSVFLIGCFVGSGLLLQETLRCLLQSLRVSFTLEIRWWLGRLKALLLFFLDFIE